MGFRFVQWQQAVLIIAPFVLLFAYVAWTYLLAKGRSFRSVVLRLVAAAALFTLLWAVVDIGLFVIAWIGTSDVTIDYDVRMATHRSSIGWPLAAFREVLWQWGIPGWLDPLIRATPLWLSLLLIGAVVAISRHFMAKSRFAIERHGKLYLGALAGVAVAILVVLLWPQPSRNPEMPSIPIPDSAIAVTYTRTANEGSWPMTTFGIHNSSVLEMIGYYEDALKVDGWTLESRELPQDSEPNSGRASFSLSAEVLELVVYSGYDTSVSVVRRPKGR